MKDRETWQFCFDADYEEELEAAIRLLREGETEDGISQLRSLSSRFGQRPPIEFYLACALYEVGRSAEVVALATRVKASVPQDSEYAMLCSQLIFHSLFDEERFTEAAQEGGKFFEVPDHFPNPIYEKAVDDLRSWLSSEQSTRN